MPHLAIEFDLYHTAHVHKYTSTHKYEIPTNGAMVTEMVQIKNNTWNNIRMEFDILLSFPPVRRNFIRLTN